MELFILYGIIAAFFWGIMGVAESVASQHNLWGSLFIKYIIYGVGGLILVLILKGYTPLKTEITTFIKEKPKIVGLLCGCVVVGLMGTYFAFKSYVVCREYKGLAVIIAYCVPVIIITIISYVFLKERYNLYAILGILMILGGVLIIDLLGIDK